MTKRDRLCLLTIVCAGTFLCGFQWPWQEQPDSAAGASKSQSSATPMGASKQIQPQVALSAPSAGVKKLTTAVNAPAKSANVSAAPKPAAVAASPRVMAAAAKEGSGTKLLSNSSAISNGPNQIHQRINEIIQINEKLNKTNKPNVAQVQAIVDQARMHQILLEKLSRPSDITSRVKTSDADLVLVQAKLRKIREETEKQYPIMRNSGEGESDSRNRG